ncbi:MAG: S-layer homology domain-containing protein [Paraburkholderia graminis]|uniref:S-layer homology domain-containing protein n=1 Tax=Paraburkholderia graminis TaxID=60548 RepID=UPI003899D6BB
MSIKKCALATIFASVSLGALPVNAEESFGLQNQGHYIPAYMFSPDDPACPLTYDANYFYTATGSGGTYCHWYEAPLGLPEGAKILSYAVYYYDNDAGADFSVAINRNYQLYGGTTGTASYAALSGSSFSTSGAQTYNQTGFSTSVNGVVDTYNSVTGQHQDYAIRLSMPVSANLRFRGVWVFWQRQIAPAPSSASFSDVPTSHPFFNEIGQLAKSGVTAGCGGGNYCPDSAVTRAQMAAFLTRALGLQWDYSTDAP